MRKHSEKDGRVEPLSPPSALVQEEKHNCLEVESGLSWSRKKLPGEGRLLFQNIRGGKLDCLGSGGVNFTVQ